jgi:hypothetical protein
MTEAVSAVPQARKVYPIIPAKNWWDLRRKFQQAPPKGDVDAKYLSGLLNISEAAAANLVPSLRAVGLIDESNKATARAMAWRDDDQYQTVTQAMIAEIYPQGLLDLAAPPDPDSTVVEKWFARETHTGESASQKLARFFVLLAAGDPSKTDQQERPAPQARRPAAAKAPEARSAGAPARRAAGQPLAAAASGAAPAGTKESHQGSGHHQLPDVHIDVQVHIDPAATAEQIDQIFASMARHLYGRD